MSCNISDRFVTGQQFPYCHTDWIDANEQIKTLQKNSGIGEDDRDAALEQIQKDTNEYVKKVDEKLKAKEEEIMAV